MFDRVYLINLKRRPDRLANFRALQREHGWGLPQPAVFEAVEGDKVGVPQEFTQGGGAWGCLRSHVAILERCVMEDVGSALVLEDDLTWFSDAWGRLDGFLREVPPDWDQVMLGGQHMGQQGATASSGVVRCSNCQRTHAYAVRGPAMRSLLNLWYETKVHIDWVMGPWQSAWKVYAPDPFIFGQAGGRSDISGATNAPKFWTPPRDVPVVFLDAPPAVARQLRGRGFHFGFERDEAGLDRGLVEVAKLADRGAALRGWLDTILWECASAEGRVAAVYHPGITLDEVARVQPGVIPVNGLTVEECLGRLEGVDLRANPSTTHCMILRGPREVADALGGFHRGYWLDHLTGQDNGLREISVLRDKTPRLERWFEEVGREAERIGAVPLVWHPEITLEDVRRATDRKVVEVEAETHAEALAKWKEA